ncbi:MAG: tributyrin esterase [Candidatus Altiarchaeota archaeon]
MKVLDLEGMTPRQANKLIKEEALKEKKIVIESPHSIHFLCAGLDLEKEVELEVNGDLGYYAASMINNVKVKINGRAGWYPADNMTSGEVEIMGDGGDGAGQGMYGGTLIVHGNTNSRTGQLMKNGLIIVKGNSGFMTGLYMMNGKIIVCSDLEEYAGESIIGGAIYFGGGYKSLGKNAKVEEVSDEEIQWLKKTLEQHSMKKDAKKFKKIVPISKRPFY